MTPSNPRIVLRRCHQPIALLGDLATRLPYRTRIALEPGHVWRFGMEHGMEHGTGSMHFEVGFRQNRIGKNGGWIAHRYPKLTAWFLCIRPNNWNPGKIFFDERLSSVQPVFRARSQWCRQWVPRVPPCRNVAWCFGRTVPSATGVGHSSSSCCCDRSPQVGLNRVSQGWGSLSRSPDLSGNIQPADELRGPPMLPHLSSARAPWACWWWWPMFLVICELMLTYHLWFSSVAAG